MTRSWSWLEFRIKTDSSEGGTKSALGNVPKVFMLAEAISDIRKSLPCANSCQGCQALAGNQFFITIILTEISFLA